MIMAKTNVPYWHGIVDGNTVHLYILVYATSATFTDDGSAGSIKKFKVISSGTNQDRQTKHYSFAKGTFDTIRINFNLNGSQNTDKEVKIAIEDLDQTSTGTPQLPLPEMQDELALDVPYVFTYVISSDDFGVEMVVIPEQARGFTGPSHSGPDGNRNTLSSVTYGAGSHTSLYETRIFTVPGYPSDPVGAHVFEYNNGKKRKSKSRNKNHTAIPFPRPRRKPKSS
ncbi:MAG TPA: hypothetical protein DCF33_10745 [Saprospirales bacterium]|nr:hypothetical protein [Saprospirales bacterium]